MCVYGWGVVPQGGVGDRHLVTIPQGVVGDRLPWGGERQGGGEGIVSRPSTIIEGELTGLINAKDPSC